MRTRRLTTEQILAWADDHCRRTGSFPTTDSGRIPGTDEHWRTLDGALRYGRRGLPGGSSLARLMAEHRGQTVSTYGGPLTVEQILGWADSYRDRTGRWPSELSGPVPDAPHENWKNVNAALRMGGRGLPPGRSLPQLLAQERQARNGTNRPPLTAEQILTWADNYRWRHSRWPGVKAGPIEEAPEENWQAINLALRYGYRGLPGGISLRQLLAQQRPLVPRETWEEAAVRRYRAGESLKHIATALDVTIEKVRKALSSRGVRLRHSGRGRRKP
jgi:hypothetical protein